MSTFPRDIDDLAMAPVVLALDERLEELGALTPEELRRRVALESDRPDWTREQRAAGLLYTIERYIEPHGWTPSWDERGLRVTHDAHTLVLGVPRRLTEFVDGPA